ncbi:DUF742 domain-containing protein [Streptomyces sp. NPDC057638]|uniref:DUF742 domain-containing protein n=1 Tax=Streptomyces sp. NPDC057638 TaxID=3346190 RepID=UPI003680058B
MPAPQDGPLLDGAAGPLTRPYTVSGGRTRPTATLDLLTLMVATGTVPPGLGTDHTQALALCQGPITVAEVSAHLGFPAAVTKVLLSDLVDCGALLARAPRSHDTTTDRSLLEAVLDGLRQRL